MESVIASAVALMALATAFAGGWYVGRQGGISWAQAELLRLYDAEIELGEEVEHLEGVVHSLRQETRRQLALLDDRDRYIASRLVGRRKAKKAVVAAAEASDAPVSD